MNELKESINDSQIEPEETKDPSISIVWPYKPSDIRVETRPMNLGDLIEMIDAGWINFDTEYQRLQNLWSEELQSRLIESILLGLRLPAFYFEEVTRRQWNIIDGLQRCCAIRNFCVLKTLRLSGLEFLSEQFDNKGYDDFPFEIRRDFKMLPITVNNLECGTPDDVKYILFKRLNTGGVTLKPQEIRTAMFPKALPTLREMAESEDFIRVTQGKIQKKRQDDKDFVSRFIAFYLLGYEAYEPMMDLDAFVIRGIKKLCDALESSAVQKMKTDFKRALCIAEAIFGDDAFRKRTRRGDERNPINKAYFEILTTKFAHLTTAEELQLIERKELLKDNLIALMNKPAFMTSISTGTGMIDRVKTRFEGVTNAIKATLEDKYLERSNVIKDETEKF